MRKLRKLNKKFVKIADQEYQKSRLNTNKRVMIRGRLEKLAKRARVTMTRQKIAKEGICK